MSYCIRSHDIPNESTSLINNLDNVMLGVLHLVQDGGVYWIQRWKKVAEEREDQVKKNEEHLKKLESEKKKREKYDGELGVVLC